MATLLNRQKPLDRPGGEHDGRAQDQRKAPESAAITVAPTAYCAALKLPGEVAVSHPYTPSLQGIFHFFQYNLESGPVR